MLGNRRVLPALAAAVLTAAVGGCSSGDGLTIARAGDLGSRQLDRLGETMTEHEDPTVPWHARSGTSPMSGCAQGEDRWTGLGTLTVRARNDDGDSASTRLVGVLASAGWDPGLAVGDLDDDPAVAVPAALKGKNPAGLTLTATVEREPGAWHYVVTITSDCASRS